MSGLGVLSVCLLWGGCVERDAGAWHEGARTIVGERALRTLSPQILADAQYAEERALAGDSTLVEAALRRSERSPLLYARLGQQQTAQSLYTQALENDPDDERARVELAALYRDMGQQQVGRGVLAEGIERSESGAFLVGRRSDPARTKTRRTSAGSRC